MEDPRRPGLFRFHLARNCAVVNGVHVLLAIALGANFDGNPALTAKGAADYVAKYISKYGASRSVAARIGSILDDIITKLPENQTMTVTQLMAKAFMPLRCRTPRAAWRRGTSSGAWNAPSAPGGHSRRPAWTRSARKRTDPVCQRNYFEQKKCEEEYGSWYSSESDGVCQRGDVGHEKCDEEYGSWHASPAVL